MNQERQIKLTKKRWFILLASCLINLCIGSLYAWSVFAAPVAEHISSATGTNLNASNLAIVFTIANSVGPVTLISGGYINDRLGPKWVIFAGGLLFGAGMILSGMASGIPMLMIGYGLGCGLAMGLVYGCTISNSVKFFPDKRGLIGGIATASYGISSVLIPPVANALISRVGVMSTFKILGVAFIIVICGGAFLIEKCPEDFVPVGYQPEVSSGKAAGKQVRDKEWKDMLDRFGFEYVSVEYVDGKVVVEYCTTNITGILSMGVIPDIEQEKNLREKNGSECQIIE